MEYTIISVSARFASNARELLEKKVNEYLKNGWILQGGVSTYVAFDQYYETHYANQAMVKPANT